MNTNEYIKAVLGHIKNKSYLAVIEQELKNHIDDRTEYYREIGYDEETSLQKAMEHIGSPDDVGEQMNRLHNSKKANTAITVLGVIAALTMGLFFYFSYDWSSIYDSTSSIVYALRNCFVISLVLLVLLICYSAIFSISVKTRVSKTISGLADTAVLLPIYLCLNSRYFAADFIIDFDALKGLSLSDMMTDINAMHQLVILFCYYFVVVLLITSAVSICIYAEFKAFEIGKANMQIIYNGEKFKYFLYIANVVALLFFVFVAVGYFSSI